MYDPDCGGERVHSLHTTWHAMAGHDGFGSCGGNAMRVFEAQDF
jgi:hypothetical protein